MTTRFAHVKKLAGLAAMSAVVTAAGLGLGAGTAQADTHNLDHHVVHVFIASIATSRGPSSTASWTAC